MDDDTIWTTVLGLDIGERVTVKRRPPEHPAGAGTVVSQDCHIEGIEWEFPEGDPMMELLFEDILNEYEEVTREGNKVWRHAPTRPDDALHALNFARLAMQRAIGELDLTS